MLTLGLGRGISLTTLTALFLLFSPLLNYQVAFAQFPIANLAQRASGLLCIASRKK